MIKFFRNIRKRLLKENRFNKYLLYAIGEIILVVIGILIALQISNSNEAKKDRAFEIKMLKEVRKEIIKDTIYFNMLTRRVKIGKEGAQKLIDLIIEKNTNVDTVSKAISDMSIGIAYLYHKGAYEAIKSVGFDKISNDSLRFALTDLYDFSFPRTKQLMIRTEESGNSLSHIDLRFKILNIIGTKSSVGETAIKTQVKKSFITDPEIVRIAVNFRVNNNDALWRLVSIKEDCSKVLQLLDEELKIQQIND